MSGTEKVRIEAPDHGACPGKRGRWKGILALVLGLMLVDTGWAEPTRRVEVADLSWVAGETQRQRLGYLASCALDSDTVLYARVGNEYLEFPGSLGLAPDWLDGPLDASRRRWVSACVLARTNAFGAKVPIILMAGGSGPPAAPPAGDEFAEGRSAGMRYEGGFFGDLFGEEPRAFVCVPADQSRWIQWQRVRQRVCSHPVPGQGRSRCGFIITGPCPDHEAPQVDGAPWPQVIHVWLPVDTP